jgi:translation initiation factor IF-3
MVLRAIQELEDVAMVEASPKFLGKLLGLVLAPSGKRKKSPS